MILFNFFLFRTGIPDKFQKKNLFFLLFFFRKISPKLKTGFPNTVSFEIMIRNSKQKIFFF
jgi:hypothetical protein